MVVWIATLGVFELVVRQRGFLVSREGPAAVSIRRAVDEIQPDDIVVIGSSEMAASIDLDILSGTLHRPVRLLTAWGATPYLLFDFLLHRRPEFKGQVILSLTFTNFTQRATGYTNELRRLVRSASSVTPAQRASEAITDWLADRFVFRNPQLDVRPEFLGEMGVRIGNVAVTPSGELISAIPTPEDLQYHQSEWEHVVFKPDPEGTKVRRESVSKAFTELRARGGRGMLLYVPSIGPKQSAEDRFPRQSGWDLFVADSGVPALRVDDVPELKAAFQPRDGIHLDVDTRQAFTRAFAKVLVEKYGLGGLAGGAR
ncbi:MAG: hypothetical protein JWO36_657 [Myxococcales bacterium]|nr:hypothetical protein [Myxococcales bacterium]